MSSSAMTPADVWTGDERPVPPELEPDFQHGTYPPAPVKFATWFEQLEGAGKDTLLQLAKHTI